MLPTHRATRARAINEKVKAADAVLKQCNGQTQLAPRAKSKFPNSSKLEAFANTATRVYRVHKFPPGGYIRPLSLYVAAAFFCAGVVKYEGVCRDGVTKRYPIGQHSLSPTSWGNMLNFEHIFRHDCRILATKILVSDFSQFYGEASPQVVTACTRLCMFPSLLGRFFATSGENRCTFLFDHLWTKKRCQKWQRRIMLRSFSEKSEKITALIFELRPHK